MLEPAGDAQNMGRTIDNNFERTLTLQFAQHLKKILESRYENLQCTISRQAGEIIPPLHTANYANRINVDLVININFFQETHAKPTIYLFAFSYNDDFITCHTDLHFYPYDQIHQLNNQRSKEISAIIKKNLENEAFKSLFNVSEIIRLPFKPLIGIKPPAIAFEAGLKTHDDWQQFLEPFATSLHHVITQ